MKNPRQSSESTPSGRGTSTDSSAQQQNDKAVAATVADLAKIYLYRHLLRNMESKRRAIEAQQQKRAPRVKGQRVAAVLARLWANDDLGLDPTPQKVIARDLGMGESDVTNMMRDLREPGSTGPCVVLVSDRYSRENFYKITEIGKQELENWVLAYYTHDSFLDILKKMIPNTKNVALNLDALRREVKQRLGN